MEGHFVTVEERWEQFYRWGAFSLLGVGTAVSAASAVVLMNRIEVYLAGALTLVMVAVQGLWSAKWRSVAPCAPAGQVYYWVRTAIAFLLAWLNPLFSLFAVVGYFDVARLLPRRAVKAGLLVTAVTMAGSQSGGWPPGNPFAWVLFGALYVINVSMSIFFARLGARETARADERMATIQQLELTNTRLEQALEENAALHAQLLVQAREAGVADERRRLAAEIHDTIAQGLAGIIAQLQVVSGTTDTALAAQHLASAAALARHSLGEARRSVQNLSPLDLDDEALPQALKKTVVTWSDRVCVRADFTVTGTELPLHDEVAATLLRIAQEALANAGKHAGASRVGVTLSYMDDEVSLDVRDDGRGFDVLAVAPRSLAGGFGLQGMRARVERIAGSLTVESEKGGGTAVSAHVPLIHHG